MIGTGTKFSPSVMSATSSKGFGTKTYTDPKASSKNSLHDVVIDTEPVETSKALGFSSIHSSTLPMFKTGLSNLPNIRRFSKKSGSTPIYLVLGCILLENIIEVENALVYDEMKDALNYLQQHAEVKDVRKIAYLQAEKEFNSIIAQIQSQRLAKTTSFKANSTSENKKLIKFLYEEILASSANLQTIATTTRAVFVSCILQDQSVGSKDFRDQLWNEPFILYDTHLKSICQLFSTTFSFKVDLIEINTESFMKEKFKKMEIYPHSSSKDFIFQVALLNIVGKERNFRAFGYPAIAQPKPVFQPNPMQEAESNAKIIPNGQSQYTSKADANISKGQFNNDSDKKIMDQSIPSTDTSEKGLENQKKITDPLAKYAVDPLAKYAVDPLAKYTVDPDKKTYEPIQKPNEINPKTTEPQQQTKGVEPGTQSPTKTIKDSKKVETPKKEDETALITCSLCLAPVRKCDVFENKTCHHRYCIYCLQEMDIKFFTMCYLKKCISTLDPLAIKKFVNDYEQQKKNENFENGTSQKSGEKKDQIEYKTCNNCRLQRDQSKMFENTCGHRFCNYCMQSKIDERSRFCPVMTCPKYFDTKKLGLYMEQLVRDSMTSMKINCKSCKDQSELQYQKGAKPDYFKCSKCSTVTCLRHHDLMVNCNCSCDKCLSTFELNIKTMIKSCRKCGKRQLCAVCRDLDVDPRGCSCVCKNCLGKKSNKADRFCEKCLDQQTQCVECNDVLDECNEVFQPCGHKICITCQQMAFERDPKAKSYSCSLCNILGSKRL